MKKVLLVLGVLATGVLLMPDDADARRGGGGGRSVHRGGHGVSAGRVGGVRHAGGYGVSRAGYYGGRYGAGYGSRYPYNRGYYGGSPYYGAGLGAAGLVTGSVIGAAAASTYY